MASPIISSVCALCQFATFAGPTRPEENAPPVIEALTGPATAMARGAAVTYEVTATDRDNDPLTFEWTLSNGDYFVTTEPRLTYTWPAGGGWIFVIHDAHAQASQEGVFGLLHPNWEH